MYDELIEINCDKISIFILKPIDIIASMMYACNGIKYHIFIHSALVREETLLHKWAQAHVKDSVHSFDAGI